MQASDEFAARAAKLFGSLEDQGAAAGGWSLNTQQGFAAGAEDQDSSADEGDEEDGGPVSLPGAAGSDEDEDEYKAKASLQYCAAFEAEPEEDEYDLLAAGEEGQQQQEQQQQQQRNRAMQVLDDNAYDRSHHQQHKQQQQEEEAGAAAMEVEGQDDLPPLEPSAKPTSMNTVTPAAQSQAAAGPGPPKAAAAAAAVEEDGVGGQQQSTKRAKPRRGVWVPPHRRPDYRPADDAPAHQQDTVAPAAPQQQQQQQRRRVTFDADAVEQDRQQQQHWQQQRRLPPARGGRGRGRGRGVPDHLVNPQKYTVYELDEPLFVGQGGGHVENQAAAGSWQQERQQQQHQQQQRRPGKVKQLDPGSRAETEGPVEELRVGAPAPAAAAAGGGDVAPMEVEEASPPRELPTAIKFAPTNAVKDRPSKAAKAKQQSAPGAARGAFLEDEAAEEDEVDGLNAVAVLSRQQKARKTFRSRSDD